MQGIWCGEEVDGDDEYEKRDDDEFVDDGDGVLLPPVESGDKGESGLDATELDADDESCCIIRSSSSRSQGHSSASLNFRRQSKKISRLGSENAGDGCATWGEDGGGNVPVARKFCSNSNN